MSSTYFKNLKVKTAVSYDPDKKWVSYQTPSRDGNAFKVCSTIYDDMLFYRVYGTCIRDLGNDISIKFYDGKERKADRDMLIGLDKDESAKIPSMGRDIESFTMEIDKRLRNKKNKILMKGNFADPEQGIIYLDHFLEVIDIRKGEAADNQGIVDKADIYFARSILTGKEENLPEGTFNVATTYDLGSAKSSFNVLHKRLKEFYDSIKSQHGLRDYTF